MTKTGTVKFFNATRGFGFIKGDEQDYFVHVSKLEDKIAEGDEVIFEVKATRRGNDAVNVRLK